MCGHCSLSSEDFKGEVTLMARVCGWLKHYILLTIRSSKQIFQFRIYKIGMYPDMTKYNSLSSNSKYAQHDAEIPLTIHAPVSYLFGGNHHGGTGGQSTGVNGIRKSK